MKKILLLAALILGAAAQFVSAQVNGSPATPVISTAEKPVYFYIESAANGTVLFRDGINNNLLGNLLYAPTNSEGVQLKHDLMATITGAGISLDNALWQIVKEGGIDKLKNKGTGLVIADARFGKTTNTNNFIAEALNAEYAPNSQYRLRNSNQPSPGVAWYSAANGNYIDRWSSSAPNSQVAWYFIVAPGSEGYYFEMLLPTVKLKLGDKIAAARLVISNSSIGEEPGQFTAQAQADLTEVIETAQIIHDTEPSIAAFQIAMSELSTAVSTYLSTANVPVLSDNTNTHWYFLQGTRPANTYMTFMGEGANILSKTVIPDDTQLWKFVANPSGTANGIMMVNKASGQYLNADAAYNTAVTTSPVIPQNNLRFIVSDLITDQRARFWIENVVGAEPAFRLHSGNSYVMNWNGNAYDNSSWLIYDYQVALVKFLNESITKAQTLLDNTVEGNEFGQYSTASRTALSTVIVTEGAKNTATMTPEELIASNQTVKDAMAAYKCNRDVSTISSVVQRKWFRLISNSSAVYASGKAISSNGRTVDKKFTFETKDVTSDAQLFSFELNETGTASVSILNKANGLYMGTDGMMVVTAPIKEFAIVALDNYSFKIVPTGLAPLHAAQADTTILNWEAGAGSSSAWRFEYVSSEEISDFKASYLNKRLQMRAKLDLAKVVAGNELGQYSNASVVTFENIVVSEEAKDAEVLTQDQMRDAIIAMNSAAAGLVINTDVKLLVSTTTGAYKWFRLINNMAGAGYASGKAMTSNGRFDGEPYTYESKDINSDAQLFRFELSTDQTQIASIINKGSGMYVSAEGKLAATSTPDNNFAITQLGTSYSFLIDPTLADTAPLHAASNTNILNYSAGEGSASAWVFEFAGETTGVRNVFPSENKIRITDNLITIDGIENFEVYSVTGQKYNHQNRLTTGIYIVKFNNYVQKVIVK